jgi:protein-S-isoprenylcysteine O-methyltransferase Ste14
MNARLVSYRPPRIAFVMLALAAALHWALPRADSVVLAAPRSGLALYFGTLPFYVAALTYFVVIDRVFCQYEEKKLEAAFGDEYRRYRTRVRRWL